MTMNLNLVRTKTRILYYSLTGKIGAMASSMRFPLIPTSMKSILIFFPIDEESFQVANYSFRNLFNRKNDRLKISFMIPSMYKDQVAKTSNEFIYYKPSELKVTPRDISFDMVVDLNPKFDFELSKFISHLNAKYTIGFKSDYSDRFYNIQLDVPPSGFLERGYKQMYNIIPTL
jgi:hypothetical protein